MQLDKLDRDILNILQQDATLPLKELAEKVHSSVATCQRRIQLLTEKEGLLPNKWRWYRQRQWAEALVFL